MTLEYLRKQGQGISLSIAYLHARAQLDPRHVFNGRREWDSKRTVSLEEAPEPTAAAVCEAPIPVARGAPRALALLHLEYGLSIRELAALFGVTESRISQLLGQGRAEVLAGYVDIDEPRVFRDLAWAVAWLRF